MMLDFSGKMVLITGGTSGIGLAAAGQFVRHEPAVVVTGCRADKGEATVGHLVGLGGEAVVVALTRSLALQVGPRGVRDDAAWITGASLLVDGGLTAR